MARFEFPAITREMNLADCAPEYAGAVFDVWVNAPKKTISEFYRIQRLMVNATTESLKNPTEDEAELKRRGQRVLDLNQEMMDWLALMWSKGENSERHWTAEEVNTLCNHLLDTHPAAWQWILEHTLDTIAQFKNETTKN